MVVVPRGCPALVGFPQVYFSGRRLYISIVFLSSINSTINDTVLSTVRVFTENTKMTRDALHSDVIKL